MIYLDNAATTFPKPESVYVAMDQMNRKAVNAGRGAYKSAHEMSVLIADTKQKLRKLIGEDSNTPVIFSPSITIALNQIINGLKFNGGECVYVSPYEHNAVARTIARVQELYQLKVKELPLDNNLEIDLEKMKYEFSQDRPSCIFCTHVSNVTGYILPVKEIFEEGKKYNSINVLDTAQSLGLVPVRGKELNADIIAFAGHKTLYGPFGIGGFFNLSNVPLLPVVTGGTGTDSLNLHMPEGPEAKYEAASENIVAIAGLNAALGCLNQEALFQHESELTEWLISILSEIKQVTLLVPPIGKRVGIVSFTVNSLKSDDVGTILDQDFDIAVRTGYHCAPYIHKYLRDENKMGTVRVSLGQYNTQEDIYSLISAIKELVM
jgi:cysteine desulfurase family protein